MCTDEQSWNDDEAKGWTRFHVLLTHTIIHTFAFCQIQRKSMSIIVYKYVYNPCHPKKTKNKTWKCFPKANHWLLWRITSFWFNLSSKLTRARGFDCLVIENLNFFLTSPHPFTQFHIQNKRKLAKNDGTSKTKWHKEKQKEISKKMMGQAKQNDTRKTKGN